MRHGSAAGALAALAIFAIASPPASADSFTPVRLSVSVSSVARARVKLPITVRVSADPGALDDRSGPLRIRVKLASECGGTYQYTAGTVLLDRRLSPQPTTGHAYAATARGAGRPSTYGEMTVCTWLQDEGDQRVFAFADSSQVNVSRNCTRAAARYDSARRRHRSHAAVRAARRRARRACGPGIAL